MFIFWEWFLLVSDLAGELYRLHLFNGDLRFADAVGSAHVFHARELSSLEVDEALVEAFQLSLDHEIGEGVLVVSGGRIYEAQSIGVHLQLKINNSNKKSQL